MLRQTAVAGTVLAMTLAGVVVPASLASASERSAPSAAEPSPVERAVAAADQAVRSGLDALVAGGPDEQYDRHQVTPWDKDLFSVAYERTYHGLPVVGGDAVVLADGKGRVRAVRSATEAAIAVPTEARIKSGQAVRTSRERLANVDEVDSGRLVVRVKDDVQTLAWETVLVGATKDHVPSKLHVFVDARTGKVVDSYDDVKAGTGHSEWNGPSPLTIDTSRSGSQYALRDTTRPGLQCSDYNGGLFTGPDDDWGTGNASSKETGCVDVMYAAQKESDMLRDWLGRNGHNGNGGSWPALVGLNQLNAYWDGSRVTIGHNSANKWIAGMDVVGHEYGHGLDSFTPGGANHESGLGEATGDIMGALTEAYANQPAGYDTPDYTVGEEIDLQGRGPIRNMYNPQLVNNDPNCYSSAIPRTEEHAAAGPMNHWFYLLAEGSSPGGGKPSSPTCDGSRVTGIGIQNAGKIFYGGMLLKTSGMTYKRYRSATLTAAKNLDASCDLFDATRAAWNAIDIPAQSGDPACTRQETDFSLALSPASGNVEAGSAVNATVNTTTVTGSAQQVSLTATGTPPGVSVSFSPSTVTSGSSSTMRVSTTSGTAAGTYSLTVKGTAGSKSHTAQYTLTVGGGNNPGTPPDVDVAQVQAHLAQFGSIAAQNGGNRRSTGSGYDASLAYVKGKLQAAGYTVTEQTCTSGCSAGAGNNLIAEWPKGDANSVYMFGAHLDGVSAGPGINDNGSGSAALLETALTLAEQNPTMDNRVRFAWWTDEEQGLNGSDFYARNLSTTDRSRIKAYYNFDMVLRQRRLLHQQPVLLGLRPDAGVLDLPRPRPAGERRGPGPLRRLLLPAGRHPHLGLRHRRLRDQVVHGGRQVGRHRRPLLRPVLPLRLRHHRQHQRHRAEPQRRRHRVHDLEDRRRRRTEPAGRLLDLREPVLGHRRPGQLRVRHREHRHDQRRRAERAAVGVRRSDRCERRLQPGLGHLRPVLDRHGPGRRGHGRRHLHPDPHGCGHRHPHHHVHPHRVRRRRR